MIRDKGKSRAIAEGYLRWAKGWDECGWCLAKFYSPGVYQKYCSNLCKIEHGRFWQNLRTIYKPIIELKCKACGYEFCTNWYKKRCFCSDECCDDFHRMQKDKRFKEAYVERVTLKFLIDRDNGICQLCGSPCDLTARVPQLKAPTTDHILPISKGGKHCKTNCQLACFWCNSFKSDRWF